MGIKYNTEFKRWEVYRDKPILRAGAPQPSFVSVSYEKCYNYVMFACGEVETK